MGGPIDPVAVRSAVTRSRSFQTPLGPVPTGTGQQLNRVGHRGRELFADVTVLVLSFALVGAVVAGAVTVTDPSREYAASLTAVSE